MRRAYFWFVLLLVCSGAIRASPITYQVTIDTSAISGMSGFLDFDFAPGPGAQTAFVAITGWSPLGSLTGTPQVNGGVTGALLGTLMIDNSTQFNDYFQGFQYGSSIHFQLLLGGPALLSPNGTSPSGSTFAFGLWDSTGTVPLLTTDPNGNTFTVDVNLDGTTTVTTFPSDALGGSPIANVQATPEPSGLSLVALGVGIIFALKDIGRRRRSA
jgi:hypothetical protein